MVSFVQKKAHKQWVWIAMEATTRQIIAFHVGDRSHTGAKQLWAKIPHFIGRVGDGRHDRHTAP
jgi:IS1 family transposase